MQQWLVTGAAALVGLLGALTATRWLRTLGYRYEDEQDLPVRSVAWVVPVTTIVAALLGLAWAADQPAFGLVLAALAVVLVAMAAIDVDVRRLPDLLTKPSIPVTAVLLGVAALVGHDLAAWVRALQAGAVLFLFYLVLVLVGGGNGMGLGDAKLAPTLGMLLGYVGWSWVLVGTFAGFLSGMVWGIIAAIRSRSGRKTTLAFGPHMVIGALLVLALPAVGALS